MDNLTVKQRAFADFYIELGNATQAAIKAGYSQKYANTNVTKLLQNTTISAYIERRMEELKSERIADQQEVLEYLTAVMRGQKEDEQLLVVGDETGTTVEKHTKVADTTSRIKAAELLGKRYAMWTDRTEINALLTPTFVDDISGDKNAD